MTNYNFKLFNPFFKIDFIKMLFMFYSFTMSDIKKKVFLTVNTFVTLAMGNAVLPESGGAWGFHRFIFPNERCQIILSMYTTLAKMDTYIQEYHNLATVSENRIVNVITI